MVDDFKTVDGKWALSLNANNTQIHTKSRQLWKDIKGRCTPGSYNQIKFPRYVGCSMSESFQDFQFFAEWCQHQTGYALNGYHIDKDILVSGNKIYHEDHCVFVPAALNYFLCSANAIRGELPQGVSLFRGKYKASISVDGKSKALGLYETVEEAEKIYKIAKEKEAKRWAQRLNGNEFIVDQRVIECLKTWSLN